MEDWTDEHSLSTKENILVYSIMYSAFAVFVLIVAVILWWIF